jgi:2-oxoglutarate ferredoxin oxidoreductase subunit gamma
MSFRYEIRLSGDVGHGLILIGKVLAEAAAIYENLNAIQSQSYGEEARGEANRSEVIISDGDILFPKVEKPDLLLCLNQVACTTYMKELKPGGVLITDSTRVIDFPVKKKRIFKFPIFQEAMKQFGAESMASVIALGIVASFVSVITPRAVKLALMARIPKGMETVNEEALKLGYKLAKAKNMITEPEASA